MTRRTRYLLIAMCFLIFLILAPLMVMYVRGIHYDFQNRRFVSTGILTMRTDPKSVDIFLDDQLARTKDGDIKFLEPGEYAVSIKKDGYFDWSKRLTVKENQVTWASPVPNTLHLFLKDQPATDLRGGVADFILTGDRLAAIASSTLIVTPISNPDQAQETALPKPVSSLIASPDQNTILLTGAADAKGTPAVLSYNARSRQLLDISALFAAAPDLKFSSDGTLFNLENGQLYAIDFSKPAKTPVMDGIRAYALMQSSIYFIKTSGGGNVLYVSGEDGKNVQELAAGLPNFQTGKIFVNYEKQIFVLADQSLYKINAVAEKIADNVTNEYFDPNYTAFMFVHGGEVSNYNFSAQRVDFVTRSGDTVKNPILQQNMSFAFMAKGNDVRGLELDLRDHQNEYNFYSGTDIQKFLLDPNAENIYILDSGELKSLRIR